MKRKKAMTETTVPLLEAEKNYTHLSRKVRISEEENQRYELLYLKSTLIPHNKGVGSHKREEGWTGTEKRSVEV